MHDDISSIKQVGQIFLNGTHIINLSIPFSVIAGDFIEIVGTLTFVAPISGLIVVREKRIEYVTKDIT